jgi:hypothetical protein
MYHSNFCVTTFRLLMNLLYYVGYVVNMCVVVWKDIFWAKRLINMGGISFKNMVFLCGLEGDYSYTISISFLISWWHGLVCKDFGISKVSSSYSKFEACAVTNSSMQNSIQVYGMRIVLDNFGFFIDDNPYYWSCWRFLVVFTLV